MSSEEVFEKVKGIIVEQLGVAETAVTMEASFIDDLGADSLDIVELIMALECRCRKSCYCRRCSRLYKRSFSIV